MAVPLRPYARTLAGTATYEAFPDYKQGTGYITVLTRGSGARLVHGQVGGAPQPHGAAAERQRAGGGGDEADGAWPTHGPGGGRRTLAELERQHQGNTACTLTKTASVTRTELQTPRGARPGIQEALRTRSEHHSVGSSTTRALLHRRSSTPHLMRCMAAGRWCCSWPARCGVWTGPGPAGWRWGAGSGGAGQVSMRNQQSGPGQADLISWRVGHEW